MSVALRCPNCYSDDTITIGVTPHGIPQHIMIKLDGHTEWACLSCDSIFIDALLRNGKSEVITLYHAKIPQVCLCGDTNVKLYRNPHNKHSASYYCPKHIKNISKFMNKFDGLFQLTKIKEGCPL